MRFAYLKYRLKETGVLSLQSLYHAYIIVALYYGRDRVLKQGRFPGMWIKFRCRSK